MDTLGVYYNNLTDCLVTPERSIPVIRRFGHPFLFWEESLKPLITESLTENPYLLTTTELNRLHCRFGHPDIDRLHKLLERAGHKNVNRQTIDYLTKYCLHYQKHGKSPGRFKFVLRADQDPVFNRLARPDRGTGTGLDRTDFSAVRSQSKRLDRETVSTFSPDKTETFIAQAFINKLG